MVEFSQRFQIQTKYWQYFITLGLNMVNYFSVVPEICGFLRNRLFSRQFKSAETARACRKHQVYMYMKPISKCNLLARCTFPCTVRFFWNCHFEAERPHPAVKKVTQAHSVVGTLHLSTQTHFNPPIFDLLMGVLISLFKMFFFWETPSDSLILAMI